MIQTHGGSSKNGAELHNEEGRGRSRLVPQSTLPKNRSTGNLALATNAQSDRSRVRMSFDAGAATTAEYEALARSPIVTDHDHGLGLSGLRRIRQQPSVRGPGLPSASTPASRSSSIGLPRSSSMTLLLSNTPSLPLSAGPGSPSFAEDLSRFPSESLHSFSFAHQSEELIHNRQTVLKRSIDFMKDRLGWSVSSTSVALASAEARVHGDVETQNMLDLLARAQLVGAGNLPNNDHSLTGPLTGPAVVSGENFFDKQFNPRSESPEPISSPNLSPSTSRRPFPLQDHDEPSRAKTSVSKTIIEGQESEYSSRSPTNESGTTNKTSPPPSRRPSLKRTLTDTLSVSVHQKLIDTMAQPFVAGPPGFEEQMLSPTVPPNFAAGTMPSALGPVHGHTTRWTPAAQAIFTTEAKPPWTIIAANDLACLVFGVTKAEKRNGSTGSASLWVKEKRIGLIWVLEEIHEDVAMISMDDDGVVEKVSGETDAIWGFETLRPGCDIGQLIPRIPRQGIIVVNPENLEIKSSNSAFSGSLFGYEKPDGLSINTLLPGFEKILQLLTEEDGVMLMDGIVVPEHSFRKASAFLAVREGRPDAATSFLRTEGLPARHRDGSELKIDVQMRVVQSERQPAVITETVVEASEDEGTTAMRRGKTPLRFRTARWSRRQNSHPFSSDSDDTKKEKSGSGAASALTRQIKHVMHAAAKVTGVAKSSPKEEKPPAVRAVTPVHKKTIEDFQILEDMGQGAYGQVKLAKYKTTQKKVVLKYVTKRRILVDTWTRDRKLGTVPLEIHVLDYLRRPELRHPNIVDMESFFEDDINYYIEMTPHGLPGMDLFDYIELRSNMDEAECRSIFVQVAQAIHHLHTKALVVHRDIKDENVILDGEGRIKLIDFGSAAYIKNGPFDVFVGTIDYAAPEVLAGKPYGGKEQDVWALGILLYTIVYKENPFYSIDEIMDRDLRVPFTISDESIDLIRCMLNRNVSERYDITRVIEHPWCQALDVE
ncbi:Serine/threonine-protein kinase ppk6 like [Verticillium longisporum]|nr:Serine/threonine-protein kinase ppk6 like [Verticillium longisporum]